MASCDVLYFDPTQVSQPRRNPAGNALGPASDGWQPCTAPGQVWTDPDLVLRWICTRHRRRLVASTPPAWPTRCAGSGPAWPPAQHPPRRRRHDPDPKRP